MKLLFCNILSRYKTYDLGSCYAVVFPDEDCVRVTLAYQLLDDTVDLATKISHTRFPYDTWTEAQQAFYDEEEVCCLLTQVRL